jgi:predicted GIY-YIG superfamily endonuclease
VVLVLGASFTAPPVLIVMPANYTVYLLHIDPPFKHARHYLGVTRNGRPVSQRLAEHNEGRGARLTRAARKAGSTLTLARVWLNADFASERKMKKRSLAPLCPICKAAKKATP